MRIFLLHGSPRSNIVDYVLLQRGRRFRYLPSSGGAGEWQVWRPHSGVATGMTSTNAALYRGMGTGEGGGMRLCKRRHRVGKALSGLRGIQCHFN